MRRKREGGEDDKKSITNILCSYDVMSRQLSRLILRRKKRGEGEREGKGGRGEVSGVCYGLLDLMDRWVRRVRGVMEAGDGSGGLMCGFDVFPLVCPRSVSGRRTG